MPCANGVWVRAYERYVAAHPEPRLPFYHGALGDPQGINPQEWPPYRGGYRGHPRSQSSTSTYKESPLLSVKVVLAVLDLVGYGYASSEEDLSLGEHIHSYTVGVGLAEESAKLIVALLLFEVFILAGSSRLFRVERALRIPTFCGTRLIAFVLAGFGFGAIEPVLYFGSYAAASSGVGIYVLRSLFCVMLHTSWTLMVGAIATRFPFNVKKKKQEANTFFER